MYLAALSTLVLAVAASPIGDVTRTLVPRASTCSALNTVTTTVAGKELKVTGPFTISGTGDFAPTGYFAQANENTINFQVVFDVNPSKAGDMATQFWLNQNSRLVSIQNDQVYHAYNPPLDSSGYSDIAMSTDKMVYDKLKCEISDSCGLTGKSVKSGSAYSCLASAKYQPDWRSKSLATFTVKICGKRTDSS